MEKKIQRILVRQAKLGDAHAFIKLCEAYRHILYNSAYKILLNDEDVADCLQETEICAWKKIGTLKNEEAFNSWIFRIMINIAKDTLHKRVEVVEFEEKHGGVEETNYEGSDITQELNQLPEKYRIPLVLYYYAGFSIKEIAEQVGISTNTVKTRLARAKQRLKIILEVQENE
ncbi:RNA polymerase sigma factor [Enterococcus sp. CWB-B31]|uniref:RNA polymerase sigma factor n=1 Tax=Enterococcus sp. CWB-B31 TaxID=2885159 RepID=UPI001E500FB8|nr:RNA polymerase sigma factor [Enterococcus sp. CWB-B31]MCB5953667.1 RNA polymerase sigma factor [Enterococcus sp. CWB-B31]